MPSPEVEQLTFRKTDVVESVKVVDHCSRKRVRNSRVSGSSQPATIGGISLVKSPTIDVQCDFTSILDGASNLNYMNSMWERLCQISQRLLVATTAKDKLRELNLISPDPYKEQLMKALSDEIALVSIVKSQIEEAISRAVGDGLNSIGSFGTIRPKSHDTAELGLDDVGVDNIVPSTSRPTFSNAADDTTSIHLSCKSPSVCSES